MQTGYIYISQNTATELVSIFILTIQMGKLRHREAKLLASKQQISGRVEIDPSPHVLLLAMPCLPFSMKFLMILFF